MRLNIASNKKRVEGFLNMDIRPSDAVDIIQDITKFPYEIESGSVEAIVSQETLEHVPFRRIQPVLKEWYRILQNGGTLHVEVPDIGKMCKYYVDGLVCDCVPRKTENMDDYKAKPDCLKCGGKAVIHTERFWFAFSGAQKHPWDVHLNHFDRDKMYEALDDAGFTDISFKDNIYKVEVNAKKNE